MVASHALEHRANNVIPNMFEELVGQARPELMEVSCEPDSILSETFRTRTGRSDSALRCALWNGHDLAKPEGRKLVLEQIYSLKPKHVWVFPSWPGFQLSATHKPANPGPRYKTSRPSEPLP